jgi:iron complex outermembrane receptor protein
VTLNARLDHWINYDGHFLETMVSTGLPTANNKPTLPDKDSTVGSPRVAALYHLTDKITAWGALHTGFRAPTLTELYRQFSVGAITTRPNDQLNPERLKGGELGFNVAPASNLTARHLVRQPRGGSGVERHAVGDLRSKAQPRHTRIYGIQTDVEYLLDRTGASAAYIYDHARVTDGGEVPTLTGKTLAQVPENRGSVQIAYSNRKYANVSLGIQTLGRQFNDDQNVQFIPGPTRVAAGYDDNGEIGLPGYTAVDLMVSHDFNSNQRFLRRLSDKVIYRPTRRQKGRRASCLAACGFAGRRGRTQSTAEPAEFAKKIRPSTTLGTP